MTIDVGQVLSWFISCTIAVSVYLTGEHKKIGWVIALASQFMWAAYAFATQHWGFLVGPMILGPLFTRNWLRWRREEIQGKDKTDVTVQETSADKECRRRRPLHRLAARVLLETRRAQEDQAHHAQARKTRGPARDSRSTYLLIEPFGPRMI